MPSIIATSAGVVIPPPPLGPLNDIRLLDWDAAVEFSPRRRATARSRLAAAAPPSRTPPSVQAVLPERRLALCLTGCFVNLPKANRHYVGQQGEALHKVIQLG